MADDSSDDQSAMDFDMPLALGSAANLFAPHRYLYKLLELDRSDTLLRKIFTMLAALCDPLTQPEDNEKFPLSVESLGQVALSLSYKILLTERARSREEDASPNYLAFNRPEVSSLRFTISLKLFVILQAINRILRADDELRVRYLQNDRKDWEKTAHHWLPHVPPGSSVDPDACLKLLYYISCVAIMGIYKLFCPKNGASYSAALNPYSEFLLRLWKTHTSIIALALEMDRELEEEAWATKSEYLDTPDLVKKALLGSSAVRTVLAWILEQIYPEAIAGDEDMLNFDICKSPLLLFYDPLVRTANSCGCIMRDEQLLMVAALIIRSRVPLSPVAEESPPLLQTTFPIFDASDYEFRAANRKTALGSAGDLMVDLYYHDQFDEDIKYVFGYYEADQESLMDSEGDNLSVDYDEMYGTARRAKKDVIEFDEEGRDWRDCARGDNKEFTETFLDLVAKAKTLGEDSDHFFSSWFELEQSFIFLSSVKIESVSAFVSRVGQVTINTVAKAIKDEQSKGNGEYISPNKIHTYLNTLAKKELRVLAHEESPYLSFEQLSTFDLILFRNPECALALYDELFMCRGLRRSLIWSWIRCVDFSMTLINYIFELVSGLRGNSPDREAKYLFSRKGALQLSQVEVSMALHELFQTSSKWVVNDPEKSSFSEQYTVKLVRCLCLMISRLISNGTIKENTDDSFEDYSHDIQVLLFPWIGKISGARELFFKIKQDSFRRIETDISDGEKIDPHTTDSADEKSGPEILVVLESLRKLDLPDYHDALEKPAIQLAFREFGQRLFYHICRIHKVENVDLKPFETTRSAQEDFFIFLTRFNDFSKNKAFVRNIFSLLEGVSVGERPDPNEESEIGLTADLRQEDIGSGFGAPGPVESEFNDAFLNGEGQFQEDSVEKGDDKKKKKKKKKRQAKR